MMFSGVKFYLTCGLYAYIPLLRKLLDDMFYKYENKAKKKNYWIQKIRKLTQT